jgi:hypothetical protein
MNIINWLRVEITFDHMFAFYIGVCTALALITIVRFAYEDIRMYKQPWRRASSKFGYNYKNGISYALLMFTAFPGLNLITGLLLLWIIIQRKVNGWVEYAKSF